MKPQEVKGAAPGSGPVPTNPPPKQSQVVAALAEDLAPRITAAMLGAYALGRNDEAAGNPVRTPLDIVENSLPADVPMSTGIRERIAQRIDQAWAETEDATIKPLSSYWGGYLAGLERATGIARSTPLTDTGAES